MNKIGKINISWKQLYICSAFVGILAFVLVYGVQIINPTYDDWLLGDGDIKQHYIGWKVYRNSEWKFPIGMMDRLSYPNYVSVFFTDSIPVLAVFFKILSPLLPETFQYFGIWGVICFALQGMLAAMILKEFGLTKLQAIIGSIMFILAPTMIDRMPRLSSLAGQWLILWAILLMVRHRKIYNDTKKVCASWAVIGGLIPSVHLYFLPMCGIVLVGFAIASFMREKRFRIKYLYPIATYCLAALGVIGLLGGLSSDATVYRFGLGAYSFNLSAFLYPRGYSKIIKSDWAVYLTFLRQYYDEGYQEEGFAWIGLGMCMMIIVAIASFACNLIRKKKVYLHIKEYWVSYAVIVAVSTFLAASPIVTYGDIKLYEIPISDTIYKLWSIFRATGRLIWPVYYLIFVFLIVSCIKLIGNMRRYSRAAGSVLLTIFVIVQLYDMGDILEQRHNQYSQIVHHTMDLGDNLWKELAEIGTYKHIVVVSDEVNYGRYLKLGEYALETDMTVNTFYFARDIEKEAVDKENLQQDTIYVFWADTEDAEGWESCLNLYEAGEYVVGTVDSIRE